MMFCKDAEERLSFLQTVPEAGSLSLFITQVHALKSASASIGSANVSALAAELEDAGKNGNLVFIQDKLPAFVQSLSELVDNIRIVLEKQEAENKFSSHSSFLSFNFSLLSEFAAVLETQKINEINRILKELKEAAKQYPPDSKTKEAIEEISDEVMMAEYANAKKIVEKLIKHESWKEIDFSGRW